MWKGWFASETPAHILPKVCWINQADMQKLEKAYKDGFTSEPEPTPPTK